MKRIKVVALTEYPVVVSYAGQIFASRGVRYDWPQGRVVDSELDVELSSFYTGFLNDGVSDVYVEDSSGHAAIKRLTTQGALALASLPRALCKRGLEHPDKGKIRRYLDKGDLAIRVLIENAANYIVRRATVHGIVNYNGRILSACEAYANGDRNDRYLLEIQKSCYQISALMEAATIFSPQWELDRARLRWNAVHRALFMQVKTWSHELRGRNVDVELEECYLELYIESGILSAILSNMFSNVVKYVRPSTKVRVGFLLSDDVFGVVFTMISRLIKTNDVERVKLLGEQGVGENRGDGIGLALICRALEKHGGELKIVPGPPIWPDKEYAENVFTLVFPKTMVREPAH